MIIIFQTCILTNLSIIIIFIKIVMSIFRNFNKTINAERLTRPNNILLSACYRPIFACTSTQPSIEYLNTLKAFYNTFKTIQNLDQTGNFKSIISRQLSYLEKAADNYRVYSRRYTESGGRLTAQGLANLYACGEDLNLNTEWYKNYVYEQIPHNLRHMSLSNLKDVEEGLQKYHSGSQYLSLVAKQISNRNSEPVEYVNYAPHELGEFEQIDSSSSNNLLIRNYKSGSPLRYYAEKTIQSYWDLLYSVLHKKPYGYILHE